MTHWGDGGKGGCVDHYCVLYCARVIVISCVSTAKAEDTHTPTSRSRSLATQKSGVGDQMRTPTIQTGGVFVPKTRLRLGGRLVAVTNGMGDKTRGFGRPGRSDDSDCSSSRVSTNKSMGLSKLPSVEFNLHRSIVAMPYNCPNFQTQLTCSSYP